MATVKVYNQEGKEVGNLGLNKAVFGLPWNSDLVSQALRVFLANKRQLLSSTKDRAQVRGGGKKPWRQKGTGRARHGSIRSPLWRHGGVTFGPTKERNFKLKINKKMARKAFLIALSAKAKDNEILVFEELKLAAPKTKEAAKIMANFSQVKNGLLVIPKDENLKKSFRNLPNIATANISSLNILDVLKYRHLIFTKDGIEYLTKQYAPVK
ncbi:MAG: 50S ribosomal protein L4 [Candidatus Azambacteria bacterium GW2011_GWA1_44_9]|uniref:Large ribosomal subunit protein uL4 n=1 Tax=Candidatus Azambacteria bacterium GW2011_GWA1_44_9 TaxID=1618610 RepID=A0A0G1MJJ6_9BACT|nr:MAG: 50S ribosomal protein L4 [Candidatus Azambacteria bacterium GW2011_GWA1_44_9]